MRELACDVTLHFADRNTKAIRQLELTYWQGKTHTLVALHHLVHDSVALPALSTMTQLRSRVGAPRRSRWPMWSPISAMDMTSDVWDTPYVNVGNGYPDMHLFPADAVHALPWEEGVASCFGRALGMDHEPVPIDPRGALKRRWPRRRRLASSR